MVPGMTEREQHAAELRRLEWLAEAARGPVQPTPTTTRGPAPEPARRRAPAARLIRFGRRLRSLPAAAKSRGAPIATSLTTSREV